MSTSVNLNSETFERAAYQLVHAMHEFRGIDTDPLQQVVREFERQVDRFRDIVAAMADNMQRVHCGESMAFDGDTIQKI